MFFWEVSLFHGRRGRGEMLSDYFCSSVGRSLGSLPYPWSNPHNGMVLPMMKDSLSQSKWSKLKISEQDASWSLLRDYWNWAENPRILCSWSMDAVAWCWLMMRHPSFSSNWNVVGCCLITHRHWLNITNYGAGGLGRENVCEEDVYGGEIFPTS